MFKYIKGYGWLILLSMLISLLSAGVKVQSPVVIKYAVDVLISGDAAALVEAEGTWLVQWVPDLLAACLMVIAIRFGEALFRYISGVIKNIAVEKAGERLRNRIYHRIQHYSYETHGKSQTGELIQRSTSDVETYLDFFRSQIDEIGRLGFIVAASVWIMVDMNLWLALVPLSLVPIVAVLSLVFHKRISKVFEEADQKEAVATGIAQESISGVRVVRAFGNEKYELERYGKANDDVREKIHEMGKSFSLYFAVTDFISIAQLVGTLFVGGLMAIQGTITVGTLLAFLMYCEWLSWPLKQLARIIMRTGKAFVSSRRISEILDAPIDEENGTLRPEIRGEIVYDHVSFSYEEQKVLEDISFSIKAGETLGILGHTGSGKSTLVMLLPRLMEYEGSIKVDGVELRDIEKSWIRDHVGLVLQEPYLFSKTVRENINIRNNHSDADITRAASIADIHSSIQSFSGGYDTLVGERGAQLSGGQKQRIAISRTIIENKRILIFDDSLSAVDAETDQSIRKALDESMSGVTRIIISHRVSTVMNADRILVLKEGRIEEAGSHDELRIAGGLYQKLWEIQTSED